MRDADNIRAEVFQLVALACVSFAAEYRGECKRALGGTHAMDEWRCTFTRTDGRPEEFEYFTGLGLRALPPWKFGASGYDGGPAPRRGSLSHEKWQAAAKPIPPHVADILHSLILDSSAASQSFESWCSEYGYDTDSRKAFATYEACQRNADKLARLFDRATLEALSETLQDY